MRYCRKYLAVCALALAGSFQSIAPAFAQQAQPEEVRMSMKEAIDYAYNHLNTVQNASLDELAAKYKVKETIGIGTPQINGSFEFSDYLALPTTLLPAVFMGGPAGSFIAVKFGVKYQATAGISASQLLFDGTYLVGLKASKTYMELASRNTKRTKVEAAANVAKAYYGVIVNAKRVNLLDANISRLQKTYNDLNATFKQGLVEKLDVDRLEVTLTNLKVERDKVLTFIDVSKQLLKFQMGMPVAVNLILTDSISDEMIMKPAAQEAVTYSRRPEYNLLQTQLSLNNLDIQRHRAGYMPSIAAFGALNANAQRQEFNFFDTKERWFAISVIGLKIQQPIFDGLQKHYRIQQAKVAALKTQNDIANLENLIDFQVAQANISYRNYYLTLENQRRNLALAQEVVRVAQKKFEVGVGSNLEVVTAETSLREAQNNYFNALYDLMVGQIDLQHATGTLPY